MDTMHTIISTVVGVLGLGIVMLIFMLISEYKTRRTRRKLNKIRETFKDLAKAIHEKDEGTTDER